MAGFRLFGIDGKEFECKRSILPASGARSVKRWVREKENTYRKNLPIMKNYYMIVQAKPGFLFFQTVVALSDEKVFVTATAQYLHRYGQNSNKNRLRR